MTLQQESEKFINPFVARQAAELQAARKTVANLKADGRLRIGVSPTGVERSHPKLAAAPNGNTPATSSVESPSAEYLREQLNELIAKIKSPGST